MWFDVCCLMRLVDWLSTVAFGSTCDVRYVLLVVCCVMFVVC